MVAMVVNRIGAHEVRARATDDYVDATKLCKAAGKKWGDYARLDGTREFIQALAQSTGIPVDSLIEQASGRGGGTWIHPRVAINFAQWVSPEFAVAVTGWVLELLTTGKVEANGAGMVPPHQVELLIGQLEHMQRQIDRLSAPPPAMLSPATPRYTLRERLRWHGWHACPRGMRRAITKHVKDLIEKFCDDVPHQASGTAI